MRTGHIYALVDPVTDEVRYVGRTINTPEGRLRGHIKVAKSGKRSHVYSWLRSINLAPVIVTIETVPEDELNDAERHWIHVFKLASARLTNGTDGGEWGPLVGESLKQWLAVMSSPETRAKISAGGRGLKRSPETRAKLAASSRGRKMSAESRAKMSTAQRARQLDPAKSISESNRRRTVSPETRAKISASKQGQRLGVKRPPEVMAKIAEANRGKKRTPEQRARMAAAQASRRGRSSQNDENLALRPSDAGV